MKIKTLIGDILVMTLIICVGGKLVGEAMIAILLGFMLLGSIAYPMLIKVFLPIARNVPTINTSWLNVKDLDVKGYTIQVCIEYIYAFALLAVCWRFL